jgi:hypothetical protein
MSMTDALRKLFDLQAAEPVTEAEPAVAAEAPAAASKASGGGGAS